jgi:hypothetical protein
MAACTRCWGVGFVLIPPKGERQTRNRQHCGTTVPCACRKETK